MISNLRVLFNCFSMPLAEEGSGGAGRYVQAILPHLAKRCRVTLICSKKNQHEYNFAGVHKIALSTMSGNSLLPLCKNHDIYFNPINGFEPADLSSDIPVVSVIHDLQHCVAPEFFSESDFYVRNRQYSFAIGRSDGLVAVSHWEKENYAEYFNVTNSAVVYHSSYLFDSFGKSEQQPITRFDRFYLYPAVSWPHKNHYRLVEAVALANQRAHEPINLVLTGVVEGYQEQSWFKKLKALRDNENIEILPHISDQELAALMTHAQGLIFPSLYEGFGIPVLEAMNYELPILTTRLSAIPEVAGETVVYFANPFDSHAMATDILAFDQTIKAGAYDIAAAKQRAAMYSTEKTVSNLHDYLSTVADDRRNGPAAIIFSDKNTKRNYQEKKLTLVIDISQAPLTESLENILKLSGGIDLSFMSSYTSIPITQQLYALARWGSEPRDSYANALKVTYYNEHNVRDKVACLSHIIESVIRTPYFTYVNIQDCADIDYALLSKAIALLDYYEECFSVIKSSLRYEVHIKQPLPINRAIRLINDAQRHNNRNSLLDHFRQRILRTSMCKADGPPGSLSLYSRDISQYSNIIV